MKDNESARSSNKQYLAIKGNSGKTQEQECVGEFESGNNVTCTVRCEVYIGNTVECVIWRIGGDDGVDLEKVF